MRTLASNEWRDRRFGGCFIALARRNNGGDAVRADVHADLLHGGPQPRRRLGPEDAGAGGAEGRGRVLINPGMVRYPERRTSSNRSGWSVSRHEQHRAPANSPLFDHFSGLEPKGDSIAQPGRASRCCYSLRCRARVWCCCRCCGVCSRNLCLRLNLVLSLGRVGYLINLVDCNVD
jgi:hypothetical protein